MSPRKTSLAVAVQVVQTETMDEQLGRAEQTCAGFDEPASETSRADCSLDREDDPVLAALAAAPWVPRPSDDEATLEEIERSVVRWIPASEFVAALGTSSAATE